MHYNISEIYQRSLRGPSKYNSTFRLGYTIYNIPICDEMKNGISKSKRQKWYWFQIFVYVRDCPILWCSFTLLLQTIKLLRISALTLGRLPFVPAMGTLKQINIPALQNYCDKLKVLTQRWHHLYKTNIEQINALLLQWSSKKLSWKIVVICSAPHSLKNTAESYCRKRKFTSRPRTAGNIAATHAYLAISFKGV